ncbi:hypothetical protein ASF49_16075 [Methylobacterium sp. Leaf104]|uniref:galactose oxidase-like domain-containing protein n=1 Tax=Methylobacterium TaxID=407 RepID=UPI0006F43FDE|nr:MULTISPECIES: galactose oxidase-like domain-containing protein [Methylobacterium]KQP29675.1 hypothetical protein ASF49_16075 [Methylobacterium sp. Leaf104]MCI9881777.1 DUF1929 domain-containing protein [Methylobacterium goesingense]
MPGSSRSPDARPGATLWSALAAATFLTPAALLPGALLPAAAAQLPVVATPVADPVLANLAIPDTAPTQGMWSGVKAWPLNAIHMSLLPTGKLLTFGSPLGDAGSQNGRTFDIWDPSKGPVDGAHVNFQEPGFVNSFCAATSFLGDGSLLVSGGIFDGGVDKGSALLNPAGTAVGVINAKLANDRYYSTMITLADGRPLIMGGSFPYLGGWADPQGSIDKGYMTGMTPEVYDGTKWNSLFGATSRDAFGPENNRWWYPRAWVAPSGRVFGISAEKMWTLDPNGNGAVTALAFKEPQRNANSAVDAPNVGAVSTAAMYDTGKILQVGGNSYDNGNGFLSSSRATIVDINGATPALTEAPPMRFGRAWANATVLPTGTVAVTGGSKFNDQAGDNTVLATELWDPKTNTWTLGASNAIYRGYHSTAGLMQNGTVLVSGGGAPGPVANLNAEFYYPPYLFTTVNGKAALAPRPQIVSLSSNKLAHAQSMQIELASQNGVSQVVLIGLAQVTHSFNNGQRRVPLTFTQAGALVTLQTPASGNLAPPGYYQLVAIDGKGVPSPGVIVALGANVAAPVGGVTVPSNTAAGTVDNTGWTRCSAEYETCTVANGPKTVRYGANGQYVTKDVTGSIACSNEAFGRDPLYGTVKACEVATAAAGGTGTTGGTGTPGGTAGGGGTGGGTGTTGNTGTTGGTVLSPYAQPATGVWKEVGVEALKIATAADGTTVTVNRNDGKVWLYQADGAWKNLPGLLKDVAVVKANSLYGIGTDNQVWRFDGNQWTVVGSGDNVAIAAASDGTVVVVNRAGEIWSKPSDDAQMNWRRLPGTARRVVAMNGRSFWSIGIDNNIYRSDGVSGWTVVGRDALDLAAASDGTVVTINRNSKQIWRKIGDNTVEAWSLIPNGTAAAVAAPNGQRLLAIGLDGKIYRY